MAAPTAAKVVKTNKVATSVAATATSKTDKLRKKPQLNFVSTSGAQIMLLVQHGDELIPMKEYCKSHDINFGGLKRRLLQADRVDKNKTILRIEANDTILVQASMRSSSLRVVAIGESASAYYVYANDIPKLPEAVSHMVDIRGRRLSCDGGATWSPFAVVEGAEPIKRAPNKQRKVKGVDTGDEVLAD